MSRSISRHLSSSGYSAYIRIKVMIMVSKCCATNYIGLPVSRESITEFCGSRVKVLRRACVLIYFLLKTV